MRVGRVQNTLVSDPFSASSKATNTECSATTVRRYTGTKSLTCRFVVQNERIRPCSAHSSCHAPFH